MTPPIIAPEYTPNSTVPQTQGAVIVLGNFDGVHLGHGALIAQAHSVAKEQAHSVAKEQAQSVSKKLGATRGGDVPVYLATFDPHPRAFFGGGRPFLLQNDTQRATACANYGMAGVVQLAFADMVALSPVDFMADVLGRFLGISHCVVGYDFKFGAERAGGVTDLQNCPHFGTSVVAKYQADGAECSSTAIRTCLEQGNVAGAERLLGRPYQIMAEVIHGRQLGRTLGFPTLNLNMGAYQRPQYGVYAVRVCLAGQSYNGVANVGVRPTIDGASEMLEVHLFNYTGDAYGQTVTVDFIAFVRPEQKFTGLNHLQEQITTDCQQARVILE